MVTRGSPGIKDSHQKVRALEQIDKIDFICFCQEFSYELLIMKNDKTFQKMPPHLSIFVLKIYQT